jgi:hypothetical protein
MDDGLRTFPGQPLDDRGSDPARSAGDKHDSSGERQICFGHLQVSSC